MTDRRPPAAHGSASIHLLDSAQGHTLQSWRIADRSTITCGMYDFAGEWAYRVGLPAKSGVGGGIGTVVPGRCGIGIFSPPLDACGNSVRGIKVCEELSERFGLHTFEAGFDGQALEEQFRLRKR